MNTSAARIGYARVSTVDQNLDAQIAALEAAECTMIRTETRDGATLTDRPEPDFIHPVYVTEISRNELNPGTPRTTTTRLQNETDCVVSACLKRTC